MVPNHAALGVAGREEFVLFKLWSGRLMEFLEKIRQKQNLERLVHLKVWKQTLM